MKRARLLLPALPLGLLLVTTAGGQIHSSGSLVRLPVLFSGGHETDPRDRGRPVALVAGALGVPPEVFREAFRHVRPAPAGREPQPQQVNDNKAALLSALQRYGVTNERLDTVSNYYRYVRSRNDLWPTRPAAAYALVQNGVIVRYVVTRGGAGYSSPPIVTVPALPGATAQAQLAFSRDLEKNGAVTALFVAPRKEKAKSAPVHVGSR